MRLTISPALFAILPLISSVLGQSSCIYASQDGYCCNGKILQKDHNGGYSADNFICCQGDPAIAVLAGNSSPTSCTAGTEIPLTQASDGGSGQSTASATDASASTADSAATSTASADANSANAAARPLITAAPMLGAAVVAGSLLYGI